MRGHLRRRGTRWYTVIHLSAKRYQWRAHDSRRAAELYLARLCAAPERIRRGLGTRITVDVYLEQWLRDRRPYWKPTTQQTRETIIRRHLIPPFRSVALGALTPEAIQAMYTAALTGQGGGRRYARNTVHSWHRVLKTALADALRAGLVSENAAKQVRDVPDPERRQLVWDQEHVRLFFQAARRWSRFWLAYELVLLRGLREGEVFALKRADVKWDRGVLQIERNVVSARSRGLLVQEFDPKTDASFRAVKLGRGLLRKLRIWCERQDAMQFLEARSNVDGWLFPNPRTGRPYRADLVVQRDFNRIVARAKLPRIHFHDCRHTCASHLLAAGRSIKEVQETLGHARADYTLQTYAHLMPTIQEEGANAIERRLYGRASRRAKTAASNTEHLPVRGDVPGRGPDRKKGL